MFALQAACPERLDSKRLLFLDVDGVLHPLKVGSKWVEMGRNGSKWIEMDLESMYGLSNLQSSIGMIGIACTYLNDSDDNLWERGY